LRKNRGNRRAVSPVLSTVILVLIVVIGMSAIFTFFVDYVTDYQRGTGSADKELLEIEDVYFADANVVEVWLYNYGGIDLEVDAAYVNGRSVDLTYFYADWTLAPNQHKRFNVTLNVDWAPNLSYAFKFITVRGSTVERAYFAPS
jgi:flagellin-like protein